MGRIEEKSHCLGYQVGATWGYEQAGLAWDNKVGYGIDRGRHHRNPTDHGFHDRRRKPFVKTG
jgi:hypothetical protein